MQSDELWFFTLTQSFLLWQLKRLKMHTQLEVKAFWRAYIFLSFYRCFFFSRKIASDHCPQCFISIMPTSWVTEIAVILPPMLSINLTLQWCRSTFCLSSSFYPHFSLYFILLPGQLSKVTMSSGKYDSEVSCILCNSLITTPRHHFII